MKHRNFHADSALLATGEWLEAHHSKPDIRIIDTRKDESYRVSHIPGAIALGAAPYLRDNGDVLSAEAMSSLMSDLGIDGGTTVIAYDDGNNLFAARLWWVLTYYGHDKVKVLDGGWDNWIASGRPVENKPRTAAPRQFIARPQAAWIATTDYVEQSIANPDRIIFDVRGDEEWSRVEQTNATVPGHIPGAVHMTWSEVIDRETMRFRPKTELQNEFAALGISPDKEVMPYCQAGIRAAHSVFALKLAGFDKLRNYEGSWIAWSKSGFAIEQA